MPPLDPSRLGEHVHGHLGWLAAIALVHPALLLRDPARRAHLAVALAVVLATVAAGIGVALYPAYRETLRDPIFVAAPGVGYLFERKEHLAFGAVLFAWVGAVAYVSAGFRPADADDRRRLLRRAAHIAFVASAALAIATAVLGVLVASYRTF
jgi:hypothetical protein